MVEPGLEDCASARVLGEAVTVSLIDQKAPVEYVLDRELLQRAYSSDSVVQLEEPLHKVDPLANCSVSTGHLQALLDQERLVKSFGLIKAVFVVMVVEVVKSFQFLKFDIGD